MPTLNMRLSNPKILIDINHLSELNSISLNDDIVCIGALSRHSEVGRSPIVERHLPLIADAIPHVAHVAVRNRGTFGGSVALADPAAELPACVLALGGTLVLQSVRGIRKIIADDYFLGLYETERKPDELLIEVQIPVQDPTALSAFVELSQRKGDYAIAGLAFVGTLENQLIKTAKLVYFGSETKPTLAKNTMAVLTNTPWDDKTRELIAETLGQDLDPMTNLQGSAKMKLHLQKVLTGRAIDLALEKAQAPR
ncbi:MAG: FAD binding domain-containing protein, partial [Dehalococcoidia bacterium]|nr:FAD binding domain-containing protein [Dehalococcoidia bacterium]